MELSGQHHASAALLPRKRPPVPFVFLRLPEFEFQIIQPMA